MEAEKIPLLFSAILPILVFCAVSGGKVGGSIKACFSALLLHQGKSKARLTWNGHIFKSMWQDYCAQDERKGREGGCNRITEKTKLQAL